MKEEEEGERCEEEWRKEEVVWTGPVGAEDGSSIFFFVLFIKQKP